MSAAVGVHALGFTVGGAKILDGVDLEVREGELLGVIGPNGAGKTTLLNALSGIVTPTAGRVELGGTDVTRWSVARRAAAGLGRSFQTSTLFGELTALENVRLAAQARGSGAMSVLRLPRRGDTATRRAETELDAVGLAGRADAVVDSLAHGEQRKVEIAMLLAADPTVLLLDEPMAGVASGDVDALAEVVRSVHRDRGRTVVMVEHHLDVVLDLADRIAVLHHGQVLACASPEAVMADPVVQEAYLGRAA